jgi:hypothetical protein
VRVVSEACQGIVAGEPDGCEEQGLTVLGDPPGPGAQGAGLPAEGTQSDVSGSVVGNVIQARDVSGGVHFHASVPAPGPRPQQLPGNVRGFVNRIVELGLLDAVVVTRDPEPDPVAVVVIVGTAGVGKASLLWSPIVGCWSCWTTPRLSGRSGHCYPGRLAGPALAQSRPDLPGTRRN